ncbi:RagB/SusD family nutrient uptake outer membrane protein [Pedobacter duraquae]|uniref:Putative outer membrane starch-binding protein n=1 Tax=Pedobacter duraquae TaxID=425511 RepID=A0A4R6IKS3_9SPHI|nr:RagB/SusD family nutrient uptake outer membrane protein [Pedobacter duraquae]TDO22536.1 putative outer membrane starch-binding protein [Pedobacter duraquae]
MKTLQIFLSGKFFVQTCLVLTMMFLLGACKKSLLDEKPLGSLNSDLVLINNTGFQNYLVGLSQAAREEMTMDDQTYIANFMGTDVVTAAGAEFTFYKNYNTYLNPTTREVTNIWNWAYTKMILDANTIIVYANKPESKAIWATDAARNAVIAEAKFYRAYTYNLLANTYGGVPLVDTLYAGPKSDFTRATRKQIYEFVRNDLEYASKWLPATVDKTKEGRIVKAAADHLLSEVYISLGDYDKSIASANNVINSGLYKIMTTRFGSQKDLPGDVFSDLFKDGNQNRSSGNLESIYVWQFEAFTQGGGGSQAGNSMIRQWAPFLTKVLDPEGKAILVSDSLGRGTGPCRGTNYFLYDVWKDNAANDMRNSIYNMRRKFYYNNPASKYFGQQVEKRTNQEDTLRNIYPYPRKVEGKPWNNINTSGRTAKDIAIFRLAETYLLRAEAFVRKGALQSAADDVNVLRNRSNAKPANAADMTLDYILDERARELIAEEPRRRTLTRMGKLVERVRKYNLLDITKSTILDKHEFFPIPQTAIDANFSAKLEQNPGY